MAGKKITELPILNTVTNDDLIVVVDVTTDTTYQANAFTFLSAASTFLDPPSLLDEGATHFYMGWESINSSWLIRKQTRSDATTVDATINNNGSYANLSLAWVDRAALTYI